jgi:hypothetical protein
VRGRPFGPAPQGQAPPLINAPTRQRVPEPNGDQDGGSPGCPKSKSQRDEATSIGWLRSAMEARTITRIVSG